MDQQLDPTIVNYLKATRQVESDNNFQAEGKSGEYGAYQFTEPTWNAAAKKYGVNVPLRNATPEQQNEVAYKTAAEWKQKHPDWNLGNFASAWNAGEGNADAYQKNHTGVNQYGVSYNTPEYAKRVAMEYQKIKSGSMQAPQGGIPGYQAPGAAPQTGGIPGYQAPVAPTFDQSTQEPQQQNQQQTNEEPTLGQQLVGRIKDVGGVWNDVSQGKQNVVSGVLQSVGALGGAIGDVTNKVLEAVPGVKLIENLIGEGVGALAKTSVGQKVVGAIHEFSTAHPELAKDIGAGFNIVTAIPILKGLGAVGNIAGDAASTALKNVAEKSVQSSLVDTGTSGGLKAARFFQDGQVARDMVEKRLVPEIEGGKLNSVSAFNKAQQSIAKNGEEIQRIISQPQYAQMGVNSDSILKAVEEKLSGARLSPQKIIENAKSLMPENEILLEKFEAGQANLQEVNKLRSDLDRAVQSVYTSTQEPPFKKNLGATFADAMRQYVKATAKDTVPLFDDMSSAYNAQKGLKFLHGKKVPVGKLEGLIKNIPVVGDTFDKFGKDLVGNTKRGILNRTGVGATRTPLKTAAKKVGKAAVVKGLLDQNQ